MVTKIMSRCSFIIVTNQDYDTYAKQVVNSIFDATREVGYISEVVVCAPVDPKDARVVYYPEEEAGHGNTIRLYNKAYKASTGDYVFVLNDDHRIDVRALKAVLFLQGPVFKQRKYKITSIGAGPGCNKWVSTCVPSLAFPPPYSLPQELCDRRFVDKDRYMIMGYPVFERETVQKYLNGYLFNPKFLHHYADNWLPFWLGEHGEEPIVCDNTSVYPFGQARSTVSNDEQDYNTFVELAQGLLTGKNRNYA